MFGYVMANSQELRPEQRKRYLGCYCGICRAIGARASLASRVALNYDMVFLALLLSSLYEPAEEQGSGRCLVHPLASRPWRQNEATLYAADMNVALAYFSADDHWRDDHRPDALALRRLLRPHYEAIQSRFPRQCRAIETCIQDLSRLESERCPNPDLPANCFGLLMAELFCWRDDRWSGYLRQMAMGLGRFIYFPKNSGMANRMIFREILPSVILVLLSVLMIQNPHLYFIFHRCHNLFLSKQIMTAKTGHLQVPVRSTAKLCYPLCTGAHPR